MNRLRRICARLVAARAFNIVIVVTILATAAGLGVETSLSLGARFGAVIHLVYDVTLAVFALEAAIKLTAVAPRFGRYFGDG